MAEMYRDFIEDQFDRVVNAINNELPTPTSTDIGKVVQVVSDGGTGAEYALDNVPNELPTPTSTDIGKVVNVVSDGGTGAEYSLGSVPNELPTPTSTDIGKVVNVVSDGGTGAEYSLGSVPNELPTITNNDHLKILRVKEYTRETEWFDNWYVATATIDRTAGTVTVSTYSNDRAKLVSGYYNAYIQSSIYITVTGGQDQCEIRFKYRSATNALRMSPYSMTQYDIYDGIAYFNGGYHHIILTIDRNTGSGTYTEIAL